MNCILKIGVFVHNCSVNEIQHTQMHRKGQRNDYNVDCLRLCVSASSIFVHIITHASLCIQRETDSFNDSISQFRFPQIEINSGFFLSSLFFCFILISELMFINRTDENPTQSSLPHCIMHKYVLPRKVRRMLGLIWIDEIDWYVIRNTSDQYQTINRNRIRNHQKIAKWRLSQLVNQKRFRITDRS